jgi:hypothetical protein
VKKTLQTLLMRPTAAKFVAAEKLGRFFQRDDLAQIGVPQNHPAGLSKVNAA